MTLLYELEILNLDYNPVPYKRTTQKQKWVDKGYKKYIEWKTMLGDEFIKQNPTAPFEIYEIKKVKHLRPLLKGKKFVSVIATYKNKAHGDTDNIAKGVNDSLFKDDKLVSGEYKFNYADKGALKVKIYEE